MFDIICQLFLAAAVALLDRQTHRVGATLGIHNHVALCVACRTTRYLGDRTYVTQETLLVGVHNRNQSHLGQVQSFTQQIDANKYIERAGAQVVENLHTFQCFDVRMDISVAHAHAVEVARKLLGHTLGEGCDEHLVASAHTSVDLLHQVVDLVVSHLDLQRGIDQSRRANQLLNNRAFALNQLIISRRSTHVDRCSDHRLELLEAQRTVVDSGGQAESVLHQIDLSGAIATIHRAHLRQRYVALVDHHQVILRKVVEQAEGTTALRTPVEIARVVLDTRAVAKLLDHLQVVLDTLFDSLCLDHATLALVEGDALAQIELDLSHGRIDTLFGCNEQICREYRDAVEHFESLSAGGVDALNLLDLVVEEHHTNSRFAKGLHNVYHVAIDTERSGRQYALGAGVECLDESIHKYLTANHFARADMHRCGVKVGRITNAIEARHARYHDHIASPAEQCRRGAQSQLLDLLVDREILLDIGVRRGQIGLGLIVVVVGNEVLDGIVRKEVLELAIELSCKRFVVAQHECRTVELGNDVGDRKGLARSRNTQQRVVGRMRADRAHQFGNCFGLVARWLIVRYEFEVHRVQS